MLCGAGQALQRLRNALSTRLRIRVDPQNFERFKDPGNLSNRSDDDGDQAFFKSELADGVLDVAFDAL